MPDAGVRSVLTVPVAADFASQFGPPIVVDRANSKAYLLDDDDNPREIGGSGGISSGTSFPLVPDDNELFYRTDRDLLYFYNGTRWLTVEQYPITLIPATALPTGRSATTNTLLSAVPAMGQAADFWMEHVLYSYQVLTTSSATQFWTFNLRKYDNGTPTTIVSSDTKLDAADAIVTKQVAIAALLGTTFEILVLDVVKTSTPGNLNVYGAVVVGRLVG